MIHLMSDIKGWIWIPRVRCLTRDSTDLLSYVQSTIEELIHTYMDTYNPYLLIIHTGGDTTTCQTSQNNDISIACESFVSLSAKKEHECLLQQCLQTRKQDVKQDLWPLASLYIPKCYSDLSTLHVFFLSKHTKSCGGDMKFEFQNLQDEKQKMKKNNNKKTSMWVTRWLIVNSLSLWWLYLVITQKKKSYEVLCHGIQECLHATNDRWVGTTARNCTHRLSGRAFKQ